MQSEPETIPFPDATPIAESAESKAIGAENPEVITTPGGNPPLNAFASLRNHWSEYLMEAGEIALYMFLVLTFATWLLHPASPLHHAIHSDVLRRAVMGFLVGSAVVAIIMTPWGKQSGGHFNPAITLTFYRLGKLAFWDTFFYVAAQFAGAAGGVGIAAYVLRDAPKNASVHYAVTTPGIFGNAGAFAGEVTISFVLMAGVLFATNREAVARYAPYLVGGLYAMFITFEAPLSGMSMNPARTFGSAFRAGYWQAFWIYLFAPTLGMLAGAEIFLWARAGIGPYCAKIHHDNDKRCIFHHGHRVNEPLPTGAGTKETLL
ncbi:MAG TPA: aquaporin [Blastocatellia bacterium]|nr:aquaporin [Blastocatellia bacterium]